MQVIMNANISGTRDGVDWPAIGQPVDLPKDEAVAMLAAGLAIATGQTAEKATDPRPVEKRTRRRS